MTKATAIKPIADNAPFFKDPDTGARHMVGKIEPKEADSPKRIGAHETPASKENLQALADKFSKK